MKKDTPRIFLDSNIWFSALYGSTNCRKIVEAHLKGKIKAVVSSQVLEESVRNLKEKSPITLHIFQNILLNSPPEIITDPTDINPKIVDLVDQKDQPIFSSAMLGKLKYFITGNIKDFSVKKLEKVTGIRVITPKEAVELFKL